MRPVVPDDLSVFTPHENPFACICGAAYANRGLAARCCAKVQLLGDEPGNCTGGAGP